MGSEKKKVLSCLSSFKVPFEEDGSIWFIDHSFIDKMLEMHKKINKRENLVGWYSFDEKITENDSDINQIFCSYVKRPLFILIWVDRYINGLMLEAYSLKKQESLRQRVFQKKKISIGMLESENIGIQQILRDSQKWAKNFRINILTNWFQIFTSFSKFFRKIFKYKNFLSRYKKIRGNLFFNQQFTESIKSSKSYKNELDTDLILLYFLNILKLTIRIENVLFPLTS